MTATALTNAKIYTVNDDFNVYDNGAIVFDENGILDVGSMASVEVPEDASIIDCGGRRAVLPGLIDVHSHSSLLKGFSENAQLMDWLPEYQREHQVLNDDDAYFGCLVSYMEALKGGTTLVADMYRKLHKAAEAAMALGLRVDLIPYAADHPTKTFFETLETTKDLIQHWHGAADGKVHAWVGLEHITYCSADMYREARTLADEYGVKIHTHTSEQEEEVAAVMELFGRRPVEQFDEYGILRPGTFLAHCVWLNDNEIDLLARTGTGVAHCPVSNMKLASGTAPLPTYLERDIAVGLGSDGGISNNSLSMFEVMKTGSLLQKVHHLDATAISAREAIELATIRGARLLGYGDRIGSLEPGKAADLITVDIWQPHLMPILSAEDHDPLLWNLVFAGRASDVQDVWVDGTRVVAGGALTQIDEAQALEDIHAQTRNLLERRKEARPIPMV